MSEVIDNPEVLNQQIVDAINEAPEGHLKNASGLSADYIRRRIRENGFQRRILPFKDVGQKDLAPSLTSELPYMIEEMESDQPGAISINYNDTPDTAFFRGDKFGMYFYVISTPEFTKNIFELMTYKSDVKEITTGNMLKDMHTREDTNFVKACDLVIGAVGGVGASGVAQNFEIQGRIQREPYVENLNHLEDLDLNNGVFLVNRRTSKEFLKWGRDQLGGDKAQDLAFEGLESLTEFKFFGVPHIATIKRTLIPDNVVYKFTEPGYLGRAYRLQDITTFIKKEKNVIRMSAQEVVAVTLANVRGVSRTRHVVS